MLIILQKKLQLKIFYIKSIVVELKLHDDKVLKLLIKINIIIY